MKFGIIGFGRIARKFVKSIEATQGVVSAIGSRSMTLDDPYLKEHPQIKVYRDYEQMLCDSDIEAVYIALPHKFHKKWILKALDHHVPVLCEKPLVLFAEEVEEVRQKMRETKTLCVEALKTKFNDGYDQLKKDLEKIAPVQKIYANFCSDSLDMPKTCFLFDPQQGGALNDIGSYILGFILGIETSEIVDVKSEQKMVDEINYYFKAEITFADGCLATAEGAIDRKKKRMAIIEGQNGTIEIPDYNRIVDYKIEQKDGVVIHRHFPFDGNDMTKEIEDFIKDVEEGNIESKKHSMDDTKAILTLSAYIASKKKRS